MLSLQISTQLGVVLVTGTLISSLVALFSNRLLKNIYTLRTLKVLKEQHILRLCNEEASKTEDMIPMTDFTRILGSLRRPRLLIRAARFGLVDYNRERDLRRLMKTESAPTPSVALGVLIEQEEQLEEIRINGDANYSVSRHIEVLVALMGEARLLPRKLHVV